MVKNSAENVGDKETLAWSLGQEDPLEEGMATHSSILAWRIPRAWWATVHGVTKSLTRLKRLSTHICMLLVKCQGKKRIGRVGKLIIPVLTKAFNPSKFKTFLLVKLITLE